MQMLAVNDIVIKLIGNIASNCTQTLFNIEMNCSNSSLFLQSICNLIYVKHCRYCISSTLLQLTAEYDKENKEQAAIQNNSSSFNHQQHQLIIQQVCCFSYSKIIVIDPAFFSSFSLVFPLSPLYGF